MGQAEIRSGLDADSDFFDRARAIVPRGPVDCDLRRICLAGGDEVVLREAHLLAFIGCGDVIGAILLHVDGAVVDIAAAARKMHVLPVIEREHPVLQRGGHGYGQRRVGSLQRAQITRLLLGDGLQAGPLGIVIGHLHRLDRRQIDHAEFEVLRSGCAGLHVVLDVFGKAGEQELEARAVHLRLHCDGLPFGRAGVAGKQIDLAGRESFDLRGHHLVAIAAHGCVPWRHHNLIDGRHILARAGPQQRSSISHEARARGDHPHQHAGADDACAEQPHQTLARHQALRTRGAGVGDLERVGGEEFEEKLALGCGRIFVFLLGERNQPLLELGKRSLRAAHRTPHVEPPKRHGEPEAHRPHHDGKQHQSRGREPACRKGVRIQDEGENDRRGERGKRYDRCPPQAGVQP